MDKDSTEEREVFAVEDAHGDVVRVIEWPEESCAVSRHGVIGHLQFADGSDDGPSVHLKAISALRLGHKLVEWALAHGAIEESDRRADPANKLIRADALESEARLLRDEAHREMTEAGRAEEREECAKDLEGLEFIRTRGDAR